MTFFVPRFIIYVIVSSTRENRTLKNKVSYLVSKGTETCFFLSVNTNLKNLYNRRLKWKLLELRLNSMYRRVTIYRT